jgi:hypothetical protein
LRKSGTFYYDDQTQRGGNKFKYFVEWQPYYQIFFKIAFLYVPATYFFEVDNVLGITVVLECKKEVHDNVQKHDDLPCENLQPDGVLPIIGNTTKGSGVRINDSS